MINFRESLQPALLDRLQDDDRSQPRESANSVLIGRDTLRRLVIRDLEQLFNATCPADPGLLATHPALKNSVLAYGMPPLAGKSASMVDIRGLEHAVADLVRRFEPRIDPATLRVQVEGKQGQLHLHNVIGLRISGRMWAQPFPVELLLRNEIDLETGRVALIPLSGF